MIPGQAIREIADRHRQVAIAKRQAEPTYVPIQQAGICRDCPRPGLTRVMTRDKRQFFFCRLHRANGIALQKDDGIRFRPKGALSTSAVNVFQARATQERRRRNGLEDVDCPFCAATMRLRGLHGHLRARHGVSATEFSKTAREVA